MTARHAIRPTAARRAASVSAALIALGAAAGAGASPADAGIPDPAAVDYLRSPYWTSIVVNPTGNGYWIQVDADVNNKVSGTTTAYGEATDVGPISSQGGYLAATPSGLGLYLVEEAGAIHFRGDAAAPGTEKWKNINQFTSWRQTDPGDGGMLNPVSSIAVSPSGAGLWFLDAVGDVHTWGDAAQYGQPGSHIGDASAVDLIATPTGKGYTIVANDGGVFTYGDAAYHGRVPKADWAKTEEAVTGIAMTPDGGGYWVLQGNGTISAFGNAPAVADAPAPKKPTDMWTDIASDPRGGGFYIVADDGTVLSYETTCSSPSQGAMVPTMTPITMDLGCSTGMGGAPAGGIASITVTSGPRNGTLSDASAAGGGTVVYTSGDFVGQDSFTFTVTGSSGLVSAPYTLSFDVFDPDDSIDQQPPAGDPTEPPAPAPDSGPTPAEGEQIRPAAAAPTGTAPVSRTSTGTRLADTGVDPRAAAGVGGALLAVGAGTLLLARRRGA